MGISGAGMAQNVRPSAVPNMGELIARCAPTVHPETMSAVLSTESRGHQFAIADAGPVNLPWAQRKSMVRSYYLGSQEEAIAKAQSLIADGHTVSMGLAQVNDRNLTRLGLSLQTIFDPCTNIKAGGKIMTDFYERAVTKFGAGERALRAAISAYNSGDWNRGDRDGYVDMVYKQAGRPLVLKTAAVVPKIGSAGATSWSPAPSAPGRREFALASADYPTQ